MTAHIALLRGINVGGHNRVAMSDLRDLVTELGFADVRTLLQSGNLVFGGAAKKKGADLERLLEEALEKRLGLRIDFVVRTAKEWEDVIARNPFPEEAERAPSQFLVMCMKEAPDAKALEALQAAIKGPERVRAEGKQVYVVYPEGMGRSKLTNTVIESKLGVRGTGRNWNTVLKLAALLHA